MVNTLFTLTLDIPAQSEPLGYTDIIVLSFGQIRFRIKF
jgi:hypothetical protein